MWCQPRAVPCRADLQVNGNSKGSRSPVSSRSQRIQQLGPKTDCRSERLEALNSKVGLSGRKQGQGRTASHSAEWKPLETEADMSLYPHSFWPSLRDWTPVHGRGLTKSPGTLKSLPPPFSPSSVLYCSLSASTDIENLKFWKCSSPNLAMIGGI